MYCELETMFEMKLQNSYIKPRFKNSKFYN